MSQHAGIEPMTGEELRDWMKEHGYSLRGLAAELKVAPSTVMRWRRGRAPQGRMLKLALGQLLRRRR